MRSRLDLLALAVIAVGSGLLAPAQLKATYLDPKLILTQPQSCCDAKNQYGTIYHCCSETGCVVTALGCSKL